MLGFNSLVCGKMKFIELMLALSAGVFFSGAALGGGAGCLVAQTATVSFDVVPVGGIKSMIFGGEGFFFARLIGPGHVWLQSMPVSRLAGQILARAPAHAEVGVGHSWGGGSGGSSGESTSFGSWGDSSGSGGDDA